MKTSFQLHFDEKLMPAQHYNINWICGATENAEMQKIHGKLPNFIIEKVFVECVCIEAR